MTYAESLVRMRRFLRDPDALIWTDAALLAYWNQAQYELATKTGVLERVDVYPYPSRYSWAFLFDFEESATDGDAYQALTLWQDQDAVVCYGWEPSYWMDQAEPADEGYRWTHAWETGMVVPADVVPLQLNRQLWKTVLVAWDRDPIEMSSQRDLALADGYYKTRQGTPTHCYPIDDGNNRVVLYPRPGTITWPNEAPAGFDDSDGPIAWDEAETESGDLGLIVDSQDAVGAVVLIYETVPTPLEADTEESDFPEFLVHYVEAATLERAFGADTDGFIPSLRDYWKARKDIGIRAIKSLRNARSTDRSFCMGSARRPGRSVGPRLPDHYPAL